MVYTIHMELREGDLAKNQNIRSSRGSASYNLIFRIVLPGGLLKFGYLNSPAGRPRPIDKPASAARQDSLKNQTVLGHPAGQFEKSNCTRPHRRRTIYLDFRPRPPPSGPYSIVQVGQRMNIEPKRQCQLEVKDFCVLKKKLITPPRRWLSLICWYLTLADIHSFLYMYDTYRLHFENYDGNYD